MKIKNPFAWLRRNKIPFSLHAHMHTVLKQAGLVASSDNQPGYILKPVGPLSALVFHIENDAPITQQREQLKTYGMFLRDAGYRVKERTSLRQPRHLYVTVAQS